MPLALDLREVEYYSISRNHSKASSPRNPAALALYEAADVLIDNCVQAGTGCFPFHGKSASRFVVAYRGRIKYLVYGRPSRRKRNRPRLKRARFTPDAERNENNRQQRTEQRAD